MEPSAEDTMDGSEQGEDDTVLWGKIRYLRGMETLNRLEKAGNCDVHEQGVQRTVLC